MRFIICCVVIWGVFLTVSCNDSQIIIEENRIDENDLGFFPDSPVNLESFNTEFDDYNSAYGPSIGEILPFCFSSTRNSGSDFDIIFSVMNISFKRNDGELTISSVNEDTVDNSYAEIYLDVYERNAGLKDFISLANTDDNEFGPYINRNADGYFFLYSSNEEGNQRIYFSEESQEGSYIEPQEVEFLNTEYDSGYPALFPNVKSYLNYWDDTQYSEIYYTSNHDTFGNIYSIFRASIPTDKNFPSITADETGIEKVEVLSSNHNDKCPFIINNTLIFVSDKPGGFGGYDLYYSEFSNNQWSEPINFGSSINSEYDEYRPVLLPPIQGYTNDLMIYSSNRPGGKGGFDLYYVGIER